MSLIKFTKSSAKTGVNLSVDSFGRAKIIFENDSIPDESILLSGFVELNEHNYLEQSDFSDMNYLYRKIDDVTYILTRDESDIYIEPEVSDGFYPDFTHEDFVYEEYIPTLDEVRNAKISNLSSICYQKIINGIDIDINGVSEHFSYTEEDQTNIKELFDLAVQTNTPLYYHSNGNSCKLYSVEQIIELYIKSVMNKMHHITYFNQLKMYINTLSNSDAINTIEYGMELIGEYLDTYTAAMAQAKVGMETLLKEK